MTIHDDDHPWRQRKPELYDLRVLRASRDALDRNDCVPATCVRCGPVRAVRLLSGETRCRKCGRETLKAAA